MSWPKMNSMFLGSLYLADHFTHPYCWPRFQRIPMHVKYEFVGMRLAI